jgi:group I intron endonuclease
MIVYLITNAANGKMYVGMTAATLKVRWRRHQKEARNGRNTYFCNAIRKYGALSFRPEVLLTCESRKDAANSEKFYIRFFDLRDPNKGYNLTEGGEGTWGWKHSEEAKRKMRQAKKGKSSHWKGKTRSEESRRKMSRAKKGIASSGEKNNFYGKTHTEETRRAIGDWHHINGPKLWTSERRAAQSKRLKKLRAERFWSTRKKTLGVS